MTEEQGERDSDEELELHNENVTSWLNAYLSHESSINNFLENISELYTYEGKEARGKLRKFALESPYSDAFLALQYATFEDEDFFDDVRTAKGEAVEQKFREIGEKYGELEEEFNSIYHEKYFDYMNVIDDQKSRISSMIGGDTPVISVRNFSGKTLVYEMRAPPYSILNHAASTIATIKDEIASLPDSTTLDIDFTDDLEEELQHIEGHIEELREQIDELEIDTEDDNGEEE